MSTYLTNGIILKKDNRQDHDVWCTIYTPSHGKISAIAKGAKKITSKLNSHLEFFVFTSIMIANGRSFKRIAGAQIIKQFKNINQGLEKRIIALYFLEAVDLLVKYDFKDETVFKIASQFLTELDRGQNKPVDLICLNKYLFWLLDHLGYRPEIKSTKQRGLISQFNKLISEITEREVKSFYLLLKLFG